MVLLHVPGDANHTCIHVYIYIYIYVGLYIYIYIHTHVPGDATTPPNARARESACAIDNTCIVSIYIYIYIYIYICRERERQREREERERGERERERERDMPWKALEDVFQRDVFPWKGLGKGLASSWKGFLEGLGNLGSLAKTLARPWKQRDPGRPLQDPRQGLPRSSELQGAILKHAVC